MGVGTNSGTGYKGGGGMGGGSFQGGSGMGRQGASYGGSANFGGGSQNRAGGGAQTGGGNPQGVNVGGFNRYSQNPTPSYAATPGNITKAISRGIPGAGLLGGAIADITGMRSGYDSPTGPGMGHDYDPKNMALQAQGAGGQGSPGLSQAMLRGYSNINPMMRGTLAGQGRIPPSMVPPANQVRASLLKSGTTDPKPWWRTPFPAPGGNRPPTAI
jgi:hypothetical protein